MPNDCISKSRALAREPESFISGDPATGIAPPFRAMLSKPEANVPDPTQPAGRGATASVELPVVPGYEIVAELGRGGMGVIYKARHSCLKRLVALKMILRPIHADRAARARFCTEAEAVARLQHPNIVQIYEVGEHDGKPFLALEYVAGGSLAQKLAGTPLPERDAARLVETLARAVQYMHQRGIIHRDLKPTNILLQIEDEFPASGGRQPPGGYQLLDSSPTRGLTPPARLQSAIPKISDFGLAKLLDCDGSSTQTEALLGTPNYMSPEQATGNTKKVGVPADVYALGAVLYELLTGRPPFRGSTVGDTLEQVRTQEPVPPRRLRAGVSRDLETICLKCLEKEPGNRYPTALALADDLHRFLAGEPIRARPLAVWQRLWKSARRRPALVAKVLASAALLCVLAASGWHLCVAEQLARQRAENRYHDFAQYRDDALFYGSLASDQGALFLGLEPAAVLAEAESAARKALHLVEMNATRTWFPAKRSSEIIADAYSLLVTLAGIRAPRSLQESFQLLEDARKLGLQTRAYHLRRADLLEQAGQWEEAKGERDQGRLFPLAGALDHFLIGEEQCRRGDWEGAKNFFNRALALQPGHFWAQFLLAVCHLKSQQWEAAQAGLNACLTQRPDFVWAYLFRSFAHEKLQALSQAQADLQKALQLNPNEDARYVLFLTRGIQHFTQGDLVSAAEDFASARALKPQQYNAYLNLAQVHLARGEFEQAALEAQGATQFHPPLEVVAHYHLERGRSLLHEKRYADAVQACDTARKLAPEKPLPLATRGRALLALGLFEQAEDSFDVYLREDGEATREIFLGRGLARMKRGKYPEAAEDYTRALERGPDANLYQHRGWAHFFSDAWKLALRDFSNAIELHPEAGDAYTGRGLARVMLRDYQHGVADAESALSRKPRTPEMMHNIACIFAQAAAGEEARTDAARPDFADDYRCRALDAVEQTLQMLCPEERVPFWRDKLLPDAALAPIHNDKRFKRLQEQYARPRAADVARVVP